MAADFPTGPIDSSISAKVWAGMTSGGCGAEAVGAVELEAAALAWCRWLRRTRLRRL